MAPTKKTPSKPAARSGRPPAPSKSAKAAPAKATKSPKPSAAAKPAKKAAAKTPAKTPAKVAKPAKPASKATPAKAKAAKPESKPAKSGTKPSQGSDAPAQKPSAAQPVAAKSVAAKVPATKVPAAKAPAATPVKPAKPPKNPLNQKDFDQARTELVEHRKTLEKELEELDLGSLNIAQSELSGEVSFDEEYADAGTFTFERERDLSLSNNIRDLLDKVDSAMRRLDEGTYGMCERCGNPIDKTRIKALPYSVLCITCKQKEERSY